MYSRSSGKLTVGTNYVMKKPGVITFISIISDGTNDVTVTCYDGTASGDAVTANEIVEMKVDTSLNGFQGGGNITHPISFANGLIVKVAGANGYAYVGYRKA